MAISPVYGDYFACRDFIKNIDREKYIVFIGELGASDGSEGMYLYLLEKPMLTCSSRIMIYLGKDSFGGNLEKELFIFKTKKLVCSTLVQN